MTGDEQAEFPLGAASPDSIGADPAGTETAGLEAELVSPPRPDGGSSAFVETVLELLDAERAIWAVGRSNAGRPETGMVGGTGMMDPRDLPNLSHAIAALEERAEGQPLAQLCDDTDPVVGWLSAGLRVRSLLFVPLGPPEAANPEYLLVLNKRAREGFDDADMAIAVAYAGLIFSLEALHEAQSRLDEMEIAYDTALNIGERKRDDVISALPDMVVMIDLEGRINLCNDVTAAVLDRPVERIIGLPLVEIIDPDQFDQFADFGNDDEGPSMTTIVADLLLDDDQRMMCEWHVAKILDGFGNTHGFVVTGRDISHYGRMAGEFSALLGTGSGQAVSAVQSFIDGMQNPVVSLSPEGVIVALNNSARRLFGIFTSAEAMGRHYRHLATQMSWTAIDAMLAEAVGGRPTIGTLEWPNNEGEPMSLLMAAIPLQSLPNFPGRCLLIGVRAEEDSPIFPVDPAWTDQGNMLIQLMSGIAHDVNNMLTIILGNQELLLEDMASHDDNRLLAETTIDAAVRGSELIEMLLGYSRRQRAPRDVFPVSDLLADITSLMDRAVGNHVELEVDLDPEAGGIRADRSRFENAVLNLLVNARDAMPNGGKVVVSTRARFIQGTGAGRHNVVPGHYVEITVADNGRGIPPVLLAKVMKPYFTTKSAGRGNGLGLSMVDAFARQFGGYAAVESEFGHGTTVRIVLPHAEEVADPDEPESETDLYRWAGVETVLLVDSDDELRADNTKLLEELGYVVIEADDPSSALRSLAANSEIDVLVTDVHVRVPGDGRILAEEIRRRRPGVSVVLIGDFSAPQRRELTTEYAAIVMKPYRSIQLLKAVRQLLDKSSTDD
jgi:signal transduction histidine kinase/CheY-like chemotaxis protein